MAHKRLLLLPEQVQNSVPFSQKQIELSLALCHIGFTGCLAPFLTNSILQIINPDIIQ
jgi:hypothetical protein